MAGRAAHRQPFNLETTMDIAYAGKSANTLSYVDQVTEEPQAAGLIGQTIQRLERLLALSSQTGSILYETRAREFGHEAVAGGNIEAKDRPNTGRAETLMRLLDDLQRVTVSNRDAAEALLNRL